MLRAEAEFSSFFLILIRGLWPVLFAKPIFMLMLLGQHFCQRCWQKNVSEEVAQKYRTDNICPL